MFVCVRLLFVLEALRNEFWWFFGCRWLCVCIFLRALKKACSLLVVVFRFLLLFLFCFCVLALNNAIR